jgi:hypothetical protein
VSVLFRSEADANANVSNNASLVTDAMVVVLAGL